MPSRFPKTGIRVPERLHDGVGEDAVPFVAFQGRLGIGRGDDRRPPRGPGEPVDSRFFHHAAHHRQGLRERPTFARVNEDDTLPCRDRASQRCRWSWVIALWRTAS